MPTSTKLKISPVAKTVRITALKDIEGDWMAWWYCGIYKNRQAESQPNVLVAFKKISDGCLSDQQTLKSVPLTALGQVTLGSIWNDGICRSGVDFTSKDFELDFSTDGWSFTSFAHAVRNGTEQPYPFNMHPLQYDTDKNWLIEFKLQSGGKLVVPCLEFFSRCYGRSQELNRILATYPWSGSTQSCQERLYAPLNEPEEPEALWKIKLRKRLRNGDTTFLAHAKYDSYTEEKAKSIHAQIETNFNPKSKSPIFINIAPWFQGPAEIRARGISFDNNRSFLALQILGCSDPDGILISRARENAHKTEGEATNGTSGVAWSGVPQKKLVRSPDIIDLTGDTEPDHGANGVEILDQDFVIMGIPRVIVDRHGKRVTDRSGTPRDGGEPSEYSSGEPHGSGKGVGSASIHARPIMDSHGTLMDMWNAILIAQKKHPSKINRVEWFTFENGYQSASPPSLIALEPFDNQEALNLPTKTRNWLYHDVAAARVRGVMVARMTINGALVYIIELQRRPRAIKNENEPASKGEESFMGLVTMTENDDGFLRWLKRFLNDVRYMRGIVQKLTPYTPGVSSAFAHQPAKYEKIPCEAAVINALSKIGVIL